MLPFLPDIRSKPARSPRLRPRARAAAARFTEPLEPRLLFCLDHVGGAASFGLFAPPAQAGLAVPAAAPAAAGPSSGLPALHSLPGAPSALYLDFDGYDSYPPYDTDADPASFGPSEQAEIREAWRQVASYFSMFHLDVTTELPADGPYGYSLVSNSIPSGTFSNY